MCETVITAQLQRFQILQNDNDLQNLNSELTGVSRANLPEQWSSQSPYTVTVTLLGTPV